MKFKWLYFSISALVLVPGIISLFLFGLKPAIDFTGGTLYEVRFEGGEKIPLETIKQIFTASGVENVVIQVTKSGSYLFRSNNLDEEQRNKVSVALETQFGSFEEVRFETVGPTLGKELVRKTLVAVIAAALLIMIYVSIRFKDKMFGISAVIAMFHDSLILLGMFSILGHFYGVEVDTLFVTAVLAILSFSVHDTIVVYDRIREMMKREKKLSFEEIVNKAVNETLVRSLNNSFTILFMLTALVLLGGETIRWFVLALLIGTVAGTYSSTFTAAPLLVVWSNVSKRISSRRGKN